MLITQKKQLVQLSLVDIGLIVGSAFQKMVGTGRVELPTSRLSVVRSNHLSYAPETLVSKYFFIELKEIRGRRPLD